MASDNLYNKHSYYELVTSLPQLVLPLLAYKTVPLNDGEVASRLSMVEDDDREDVVRVVELLSWQKLEDDDANLNKKFKSALRHVKSSGLRELLKHDMRYRTILKALTISCAQGSPSSLGEDWGYDESLVEYIRFNWESPSFALGLEYPNIIPIRKLLMEEEYAEANNLVEHVRWSYYLGQNDKFEFSVENIALFLIQREMLKRRLECDSEKTTEMVKEAITTMIDKMELSL